MSILVSNGPEPPVDGLDLFRICWSRLIGHGTGSWLNSPDPRALICAAQDPKQIETTIAMADAHSSGMWNFRRCSGLSTR